jgi:SAM-dependent methyltransferase
MSWRDFWNTDTPIYVNERHKALHYGLVARDIVGLIPSRDAAVLDYACGEALSAGRVAASCGRLYLCDGAPLVRERLHARFRGDPKVIVLSPEEMETVADGSLDLVVVNSLLQYLSVEEFGELLSLWRRKLKTSGQLVVADVIPPDIRAVDDAAALLSFAWKGGFLVGALKGLARTAVSDYRTLRAELGLTHYSESEMLEILRGRGFAAERRPDNLGHNPKRMTFLARPIGDD